MDKSYKTELHRSFLLEGLPDPLTRASAHIQIFDNYIANTRLRMRTIRDPQTKAWTWILQQRFPAVGSELTAMKIAEIYLNEAEHERFKLFEGMEIRKNRYFHEFDAKMFAFDVYIGELWGLNMARVEFENIDELRKFEPPPFVFSEVSNETFFLGENLVGKKFEDIQTAVAKMHSARHF